MAIKICDFCAVRYDSKLTKCPYCGCTDYKAAEMEYMNQLEDIREDMEQLGNVPKEEMKKAFRVQARFVGIVFSIFFIAGIIFGGWKLWMGQQGQDDLKEEFLWKQENFPEMDQLYAAGEYEQLVYLYREYLEGDQPIWEWEHFLFCDIYNSIMYVEEILKEEADGHVLEDWECTSLLYDELNILGSVFCELDEQESKVLSVYMEPIQKDFDTRWHMSEEDFNSFYKQLEKNGGWVTYDSCEEYIKEWYRK